MSLSSLIVQREIASIREIEEALARQVLYGGDFVTNLFEVSKIEEAALMPVVAESFGLAPAPTGELPKVPEDAVRLVAAEVAGERALAPLEVGSTLVVAVAEPLAKDVEQELTFALALPIEQRIAPLFRIRQALARDYGLPIDKRTSRLITKIVHKGPKLASTFPPPLESQPRLPARPPSLAPPPVPKEPPPPPNLAATASKGTLVRPIEAPPARPAKRRRGPLTMDLAVTELESSAERDVIFDVLFEFARQFFDYTALFIVHGEIAEGRDAFGDGAAREKVARMGVPLDLKNLLSDARAAKRLTRSRPKSDGLDPVLMADLGRDGLTECVVFPIIVRTRVVALLLGDGGISGVDDVGVKQVEDLIESAVGAFERLIVRRKLKAATDPPQGEKGAAAAKRKAESLGPPPTQLSAPPAHHVRSTYASDRPAAEELAPPIRELMAEPISRVAMTTREPTAQVITVDTASVRSDQPPPANLLAVRRPSGAPIPREEPESQAALGASASAPAPASTSTPPKSRPPVKRAEAPPLEFGTPQMPLVSAENRFGDNPFGQNPFADDPAERQLLAQIRGPSEPPLTTPDAGPWARGDREPSAPPQVHPWGREPSNPGTQVVDPEEVDSVAPFSPKAVSPPPMRAAPITDVSPQPIGPISGIAAIGGSSVPPTDLSPPSIQIQQPFGKGSPRVTVDSTPTPAAPRTLLEGQIPSLSDVVEKSAPISPIVVVTPDKEMKPMSLESAVAEANDAEAEDGITPIAPVIEPIITLSSRKGMPPVSSEPRPMPPSEQQVSVPAHKPPSSRSDHSRILPSVIVDVASEYVSLVDRVLAGPDDDAETDLLRAGGYAMPAIMAKFPGPIVIEPERLTGPAPLPRVADCGPIIRLVASQRRTALPFVLSHVESPLLERRYWATYLLTELVYPDAIDAAIARTFDDDVRVRRVAKAAVRALAEAHPQLVVERLADVVSDDRELWGRRVQAVEAIGEAREPLGVPVLLPLIEAASGDVTIAARFALIMITRQDFGLDASRWQGWWEANKHRHRLEWLIDSLMHEQRALRGSASEELRLITKEYFGYYDDLPKRERLAAQLRYREWWENIGRVRFSRASTRGR